MRGAHPPLPSGNAPVFRECAAPYPAPIRLPSAPFRTEAHDAIRPSPHCFGRHIAAGCAGPMAATLPASRHRGLDRTPTPDCAGRGRIPRGALFDTPRDRALRGPAKRSSPSIARAEKPTRSIASGSQDGSAAPARHPSRFRTNPHLLPDHGGAVASKATGWLPRTIIRICARRCHHSPRRCSHRAANCWAGPPPHAGELQRPGRVRLQSVRSAADPRAAPDGRFVGYVCRARASPAASFLAASVGTETSAV